jgi:hypothetical protein
MSEIAERMDILRRIGERGLRLAASAVGTDEGDLTAAQQAHEEHLDLWQHLLDELKRVPQQNGDNK